ncbi:hypothetical protein LPJ75_001866, partial [Coemansia sp. RSA 2598]
GDAPEPEKLQPNLHRSAAAHRPSTASTPSQRPKTAVHIETLSDEMPKRPSTSHAKSRKSLSGKRRSKSSGAFKEKGPPLAEVIAADLPPIVTRPEMPAAEPEESVAQQSDADPEAAEEVPARDSLRPATTSRLPRQRPASAHPSSEPPVPRQRPQTCVALSAAEPEHAQARKRPGTAAPAVAAINAKPYLRSEIPSQLPVTEEERARPATTGHLNDPISTRPATAKSQRKSHSRPTTSQTAPRPRTAVQNKRDRRYSEWRDIHVQSLSRVNSILREAVGLDAMGGAGSGSGASGGSRWSALMTETEPLPLASSSGLGISIGGPASRSTQRPETTYARMSSSLRQRSDHSLSFLDHDFETLSKSLQESASAADDAPRPRTTDASFDCLPAVQRPISGKELQRASSVYSAGQQRPATSHSGRRQMSMYNPAVRQIQLSRDETRRSRLFAEYEKLVGSKDKPHDDDDDEDSGRAASRRSHNRSGLSTVSAADQLDAACVEDSASSAESPDATPKVSLDNIAEEDEDDYAEAKRRDEMPLPVSSASTIACEPVVPGDPREEAFEGRRAMDQPFRRRPSTVHVRTSAELQPPVSRHARHHSASMRQEDDVFSTQQSQKRWTRMINMNQHLFDVQAVVASGALGENSPVKPEIRSEAEVRPDVEDVPDAGGENEQETGEEREDAIAEVISLASNECASDLEGEMPPAAKPAVTQTLTLDLPPAVDLFQDVEQALAERLPPMSARSSTPRGTTFAGAHEAGANPLSRPLGAMPLYSPQAFSAFGVNIFGGRDQQQAQSPRVASSHYAESNISALSLSKAEKRSSVYVVNQDFYASAIFASDELPYQKERRSADAVESSAQRTMSPLAQPAGPQAQAAVGSPVQQQGELQKKHQHHIPILGHAKSQKLTAVRSADNVQRHSELVRQQLRLVEGSTPAEALGQALAKGDDAHREMLQAYMKRFDFHDQPIDFALRQLFQQLHLPAESQQIDRVISGFAEHYHRCNPGVFFSSEIVYAYAFAILLLHTDAHNPRVKQKMTKAQFISQAKLLDDGDEMFDEILDVLYDNVTMVRFEYAPTSAQRPQTADAPARDHSQGISGWLRRMFTPAAATSAPVQSPVPLSPQGILNKQQYSYTSLSRRAAPQGMQMLTPVLSRPTTANAVFSPTSPEIPSGTLRGRAHTATTTTPPISCAQISPTSPPMDMSPVDSPPAAQMHSGFTTADISVAAQPMAVETIRLSSLKSHVKRRPSLRQGRPLSGIVNQPPSIGLARQGSQDSMAQLRVDMAGLVSRKIELHDNGRRALVRRWKQTYLVLSGSRLYFFRPDAGSHHDHTQAQAIMSIVPLRHGVAIVDSQYNKYPHVFRILAGDGGQILIKASDDDSVAEWMARINCAAAFKTMEVARREKPFMPDPARAQLLETRLLSLDSQLSAIDDKLERYLRLFKQLAAMVPLTKASRTKIVHHADQVRDKLKEVYLNEQRLTCYKDVLHLDLTI